jgi:hypothetical protein
VGEHGRAWEDWGGKGRIAAELWEW